MLVLRRSRIESTSGKEVVLYTVDQHAQTKEQHIEKKMDGR